MIIRINEMTEIFLKLLNISFSASLLILACIIIRYAFKGMPKYMRCILWLLGAGKTCVSVSSGESIQCSSQKEFDKSETDKSNLSDDSSRLESAEVHMRTV